MNRPETRIIKQKVWDAAQQRVFGTFERYTRKADEAKKPTGVPRAKVSYLLSGLLVCAECNSPLTLSAGTNAAYYRCQTNRKQVRAVAASRCAKSPRSGATSKHSRPGS